MMITALRRTVFVLCCSASLQLDAATYSGRVVGVADGDTITVLDATNTQHKVRFDAPEKAQAFGQVSKQSPSTLVFSKTVVIDTTKTDKYGREVGKVLVNGQADTNPSAAATESQCITGPKGGRYTMVNGNKHYGC